MQGDTTGQVHRGGQIFVPKQGGHPVPMGSVAEGTKRPLAYFSELFDFGMTMHGVVLSQPEDTTSSADEELIYNEGVEALEKQRKKCSTGDKAG